MVDVTFRCTVCHAVYEGFDGAAECELQGYNEFEGIEVGDIVTAGDLTGRWGRFGWLDGDEKWIAKRYKLNFHEIPSPTYDFFYVVTAVDHDPRRYDAHHVNYYVRTLAMTGGYGGGWTRPRTHINLYKAKRAPAVVREQAKALIGERVEHLL